MVTTGYADEKTAAEALRGLLLPAYGGGDHPFEPHRPLVAVEPETDPPAQSHPRASHA